MIHQKIPHHKVRDFDLNSMQFIQKTTENADLNGVKVDTLQSECFAKFVISLRTDLRVSLS